MDPLLIPEYRPDLNDLNKGYTQSLQNVMPQADGYGPAKDLSDFTESLPGRCRGYFYGIDYDNGAVRVFAATSTKLYLLDNSTLTWTDVSAGGGSYTELSSQAHWRFAQFNNYVIAVQANAVPQVYNMASPASFAALSGSPPQAAYVSTINRFLVLGGLADYPNGIQWSGLNDITVWDGTLSSGDQVFPDGGAVVGVTSGEFGWIIQQSAIRRMVFVPGSEVIFQINKIHKNIGSESPHSIVEDGGTTFFYSNKGFVKMDEGGGLTHIGRERVDKTFLNSFDLGDLKTFIGASDPLKNRIQWAYKNASAGSIDYSNEMLVYDYLLDKWTPVDYNIEYLSSISVPGTTLDSLDEIGQIAISGAANNGSGLIRLTVSSTSGWVTGDYKHVSDVTGTTEANGYWTITVIDATHIDLQGSTFSNAYASGGYVAGALDDLEFSLDEVTTASIGKLGAFNSSHQLCTFEGDNLEATLQTAEQSSIARRLFIRGVYPITDAENIKTSIAGREKITGTAAYSAEKDMNDQGFAPAKVSTRFARIKFRIPAAETWSFVTGGVPDFTQRGRR